MLPQRRWMTYSNIQGYCRREDTKQHTLHLRWIAIGKYHRLRRKIRRKNALHVVKIRIDLSKIIALWNTIDLLIHVLRTAVSDGNRNEVKMWRISFYAKFDETLWWNEGIGLMPVCSGGSNDAETMRNDGKRSLITRWKYVTIIQQKLDKTQRNRDVGLISTLCGGGNLQVEAAMKEWILSFRFWVQVLWIDMHGHGADKAEIRACLSKPSAQRLARPGASIIKVM